MSKTWIVILTIVITAVVAVGASYYYLNNKAEEEKTELQNQIDELKDQVSDLQAAEADTSTTTEVDDDELSWKTYQNSKYGFSLTFGDKWEGYRVDDWSQTHTEGPAPADDSYDVYVPTSDKDFDINMPGYANTFRILVYTKTTYQALEGGAMMVSDNVLGEKNDMVFVVSYWQDSPSDLRSSGLSSELESIASTFEFTN